MLFTTQSGFVKDPLLSRNKSSKATHTDFYTNCTESVGHSSAKILLGMTLQERINNVGKISAYASHLLRVLFVTLRHFGTTRGK